MSDELKEVIGTFREKHGITEDMLRDSIARAVREHDGDSLLMLREMALEAARTITSIISAGGPRGENN